MKEVKLLNMVLSEGRGNIAAEQVMTASSATELADLLINFAKQMKTSHLFSEQRLKKVLQRLFKDSDDVKQSQVKITIKLLSSLWNALATPDETEK